LSPPGMYSSVSRQFRVTTSIKGVILHTAWYISVLIPPGLCREGQLEVPRQNKSPSAVGAAWVDFTYATQLTVILLSPQSIPR
jgi:hypothetical protein